MKEFQRKVAERLTGAVEKNLICRIQILSTIVFLPMGMVFLYFREYALAVMFSSEALGQLFMAGDNVRTLKEGDDRYRYLPATTSGKISTIIFSVTVFSRFILAEFFVTGMVMMSLMILGGFFWKRPEESGGPILAISAFFLSTVAFMNGGVALGIFQLLYAMLLVMGVAFFRASRGEVINIVLWAVYFFTFFASPQT